MSVTNLTYTKWTIVSQPDVSTDATYNLDFQTNGEQGNKIRIRTTGIVAFKGLNYTFTNGTSSLETRVYNPTNYTWTNTAYKNITITGGEDVENANLIAWLEANAIQDTSFPGEVSCYYKNNWIGGFSNSGSHKFDTEGTWLEDDITINYLRPSGSSIIVSPLSVTSNGTYTASSGTAYSPVTVNVSGGIDTVVDFIENHDTYSSFANSSATKIAPYTFYSCKSLKTVDFQACSIIGSSAFGYCTSLTTISFPECTQVNSGAFYSCASLSSASLSKCTIIRSGAFYSCKKLSTIYAPICSNIQASAFYGAGLTSADFPSVSSTIGIQAFAYCSSMETISFPECPSTAASAFWNCYKLKSVELPKCKYMNGYTFSNCSSLSVVSLPMISIISGTSNFYRCYNLVSLYLLGSSVAKLSNSNTFTSTPIAGYTTSTGGVYGSIYVPSSLYSSYISATNWTYFSSRFVSV